jgi:hypothetical protein
VPTISLKPQGNGTYSGWSSIIGATYAYQAVDDSDGTTHDSEDSYFVLPRLAASPAGIVSFPFFLQWAGGRPTSIAVNVVAQRGGAAHPQIEIGFVRLGTFAFSGSLLDPGVSWTLATRTFTTDPITGAPWDAEDLRLTEVCLRSEALAIGSNDVTLVSVVAVYLEPFLNDPVLPHAEGLL